MPRFYTLPPMEIPYPYVLINARNYSEGLYYISKHRSIIEAVIIDSGVEIFRNGAAEYPGGPENWIQRLWRLWKDVKRLVPDAEVYVTCHDYPDDYAPRSLWIRRNGLTVKTNIERTLDNILHCTTFYPDVDWLIPVQGHYENPKSIEYSIRLLEENGVVKWAMEHTKYFAVAMLCVSRKCSVIEETVMRAWRRLPSEAKIHVFGPAANCVKRVWRMIFSFDSTAWTRPREPNGSSAYTSAERAYLFLTWIHKYADIIELPYLPKSMRKRLG